uniref:K Homology domain-containing protein n=1 Tax=Kalanchoe fedtschenkoi TaxID=63787 RepID=A0A7N0TNJ8_KALFE
MAAQAQQRWPNGQKLKHWSQSGWNSGVATLRLLCHVFTSGGVIGHGGSIVRGMESRIGVRIQFSGTMHDCVERIVSVTGSSVVCGKVRLRRMRRGKEVDDDEDEDEEVFDVSPVQEALLRVFERAVEVEAEAEAEKDGDSGGGGESMISCCCRVLADQMQCGILIGKGGKNVAKICRETRANIRVLRSEQNPACASPEDKIIHIIGGLLSVKRALLSVSKLLQDLSPTHNGLVAANVFPNMMHLPTMSLMNVPVVMVPRQELPDPHAEFFPDLCVPIPAATGVAAKEVDPVNFTHSVREDDEQCEVVFRMICSNNEAGAVIGKGAAVVRLLQNESGAFIQFAPAVDGVGHRLVIISALEGLRSSYSPAQNAVVRIVATLAEITAKESHGSKVEDIAVRLVINPAQADSFRGDESILSEISDVEISILEGDVGQSLLTTDEIMQVTGEYRAVQKALLQVTKKLRDSCFSGKTPNGAGMVNYLSCVIPDVATNRKTKNANFPPFRKSIHKFPNFNPASIMWGVHDLQISNRSREQKVPESWEEAMHMMTLKEQ